MLPFLHEIEEWTKKAKEKSGFRVLAWPIFLLGLAILLASLIFMRGIVVLAAELAFFCAPVWLPFMIVGAGVELWVNLVRSRFIHAQEYLLLEVKPPRNIEKTPLAMEAMLSGLHLQPNEGTWYKKYILGSMRPWFSLEIASLEGHIHFFIWARANYRRQIEAHVYAQYPGAQITEAADYTRFVTAKVGEWNVWGCDFTKSEKDPVPIKTYVEYGLDKVQKEPEQVDPLANLIEFMASLGKGEYLWLQFLIRTHKGEKYQKRNAEGKPYTWRDEGAEIVDEIRKKTREPYTDSTGNLVPGFPNPTKGQTEKIAAIERNTTKLAFDVGARGIYLADQEHFNAIAITGLIGLFRQFSSEGWNGVKPTRWMYTFDDYPWEVGASALRKKYQKEVVEAFRRRQFFYPPFRADAMVMSTEEIATVYHIPSQAVETPSLPRVQSATGEAPANLPV